MAFVHEKTLWESVGGGFHLAGEERLCKVGKHKLLVRRSERLNRMGNPIHYVTYVHPDGTMGKTFSTTGSAMLAAKDALRSEGIEVRKRTPRYAAKKPAAKKPSTKKPAAKKPTGRGKR